MNGIKAHLVEPTARTMDFAFTDSHKARHARRLVLKPWTIANEIEITQAQGGRNAVAERLSDDNPLPIFQQFCHQLEAESLDWLAGVFECKPSETEHLADVVAPVLMKRLSPAATAEFGSILIATQQDAWPELEKKSRLMVVLAHPVCLISIGWLAGSCTTLAWQYLSV